MESCLKQMTNLTMKLNEKFKRKQKDVKKPKPKKD